MLWCDFGQYRPGGGRIWQGFGQFGLTPAEFGLVLAKCGTESPPILRCRPNLVLNQVFGRNRPHAARIWAKIGVPGINRL